MVEDDFLPVGKIVGVHGINGNLKLYPYVESLSLFKSGHKILLRNPDGKRETHVIKGGKLYKNIFRLTLKGIDNRNDAEKLIGTEVFVEKIRLPDLEEDEHYWFEIIGLDAFLEDGTCLGRVESILQTGSNDVYVIRNSESGKETLVPAIQSVVAEIDLEKKRMTIILPDGL
ncbi:MAG: 16S rRNA processing protein RimM [Deltaproteobacteria bacterium]|nr:16S rRNA processing protein RimM [Deltaproteobacteria bacterium]